MQIRADFENYFPFDGLANAMPVSLKQLTIQFDDEDLDSNEVDDSDWVMPLQDAHLMIMTERIAELRNLHLSYCLHLTDASMAPLLAKFSHLTELDLELASGVTDASFLQFQGSQLQRLELNFLVHLSDASIVPLLELNKATLRFLNLRKTRATDAIVPLLSDKLCELNVSRTRVTIAALLSFIALRPPLKTLGVSFLAGVDDAFVEAIRTTLTGLSRFYLRGCHAVVKPECLLHLSFTLELEELDIEDIPCADGELIDAVDRAAGGDAYLHTRFD